MGLTPDDIEQHHFRERFRGYDPDEVDVFLDRVVGALRSVERERDDALAARDAAEQQAGQSETLLRETLANAQRTAEQTVADARTDAERIRQRAHQRAEAILADAQAQARELVDAIEELLDLHERLRESIRATLAEHADLLDRPGQLPPTAEAIDRVRRSAEQPASPAGPASSPAAADAPADPAADPSGWPEPPDPGRRAPASREPPSFDPPPPR